MSRRNTVKRAKTERKQRLEMDALWARLIEELIRREGLEDKWAVLDPFAIEVRG